MAKYKIYDYELDNSYFGNDNYSYRLDTNGNSVDEMRLIMQR